MNTGGISDVHSRECKFIMCLAASPQSLYRVQLWPAPQRRRIDQFQGASVWSLQLETSHCSFYPGQKAGNLSFNTRRISIFPLKGNNALGHVITHEGAPRVALWAERGNTELGLLLALSSSLSPGCVVPVGAAWEIRVRAGLVPSLGLGFSI